MDYVKKKKFYHYGMATGFGHKQTPKHFSKVQNYSDFRTTACYSMMN